MSDISEHDRKIVEAADKLVTAWGDPGGVASPEAVALRGAVAAKREAARPKLLTAEEVIVLWQDSPGNNAAEIWSGVLAAAHARAAQAVVQIIDDEFKSWRAVDERAINVVRRIDELFGIAPEGK